jgi:hypothetical protein
MDYQKLLGHSAMTSHIMTLEIDVVTPMKRVKWLSTKNMAVPET